MMSWLNLWKSVSLATRKAALLGCGAILWATLALAAAAPARADVCDITGGRLSFTSFDGSVDYGQQITAHVGQQVFLRLQVRLPDGSVQNDLDSSNTRFAAGTGAGSITNLNPLGQYVPAAADAKKQFPLYAIFHDNCRNVNWTFTVSLHVIP